MKDREDWLLQVQQSQRNIVFPDTASNEARFWKNVISGKTPLTTTQRVGLTIIALALGLPLWFIVESLASSILAWLLLAFYAGLFLLLRWRVHKALGTSKTTPRTHQRHPE
jgi:Flp pilus assembly protein TadB